MSDRRAIPGQPTIPSLGVPIPSGQASHTTAAPTNAAATQLPLKLQAAQPAIGDSFFDPTPATDCGVYLLPTAHSDFSPDPIYGPLCYDSQSQIDVYAGKTLNKTQRPLVEWGRCLYPLGMFPRSLTLLGNTNLVTPQLFVYGDFRTGVATHSQQGNSQTVWGNRLNLDIDFELTATERFHAFVGPLDQGPQFTRLVVDNGQSSFVSELDSEFDFAYFEGDLGALWGGFVGEVMPFTLPFAVGSVPLFIQNGYWIEDAFLGLAATLPARNSPLLDWSNFDVTFFYGFDKLDSPAFGNDDNAARAYGLTTWIEAYGGYIELGYSYLEDRQLSDRSYHNLAAAYTFRYRDVLSTGVRVIANTGQSPEGIAQSADGTLLVWENSLITKSPWNVVPYFNLYAGLDRPQSVARAAVAGGILKNIGINFETDGLTGYPTLDASANNTWGGALGLNLLPADLSQQLISEFAFVQPLGSDSFRQSRGPQYGLGMRYQLPLSNAVIFRVDGMVGLFESDDNVSGLRFELRHKF